MHFATHPRFHSKPTSELLAELWEDLAEHNVLIAPGTMFSARDFPQQPPAEEGALAVAEDGDAFFRIAFSTATAEQIHEAAKIIAQRVEHFFRA